MAAKAHIEKYGGAEVPSGMVPRLGRSKQRSARAGLGRHAHEVFEICLIEDGQAAWMIEERAYRLGPGSVFVTGPGERHGAVIERFEPCTLAWLQVDQGRLKDRGLVKGLESMERRVWRDPAMGELIALHEGIMAECRLPREDSRRVVEAKLVLLLTAVLRGAARERAEAALPEALRKMLGLIEREGDRRLTLPDLQAVSGLERSRVHDLFRQHLGQSPGAFLQRRRMRVAQVMLREPGRAITEIAYALGFSSSQHFSNAFRTRFGMTPSAYRRIGVRGRDSGGRPEIPKGAGV